jgi:hypothetical protein
LIEEIIKRVHQNVEQQLEQIREKLLKIEFEEIKKDQKQVINVMAAIIEELEKKKEVMIRKRGTKIEEY